MLPVVALIPLRRGSKGIPGKNIRPMAGKPLCAWVIEAACGAKSIDSVYVSTDCPEIARTVRSLQLDVAVVDRPKEYATDEASTEAVMLHFMSIVDFGTLLTIQATSPLLCSSNLDRALQQFFKEGFDSMLSGVRSKRFYWTDDANPLNYMPCARPRRQDFKGSIMENGAFYITSRQTLEKTRCRLGGKIGIHEMSEVTGVELDVPSDWPLVEKYLLESKSS